MAHTTYTTIRHAQRAHAQLMYPCLTALSVVVLSPLLGALAGAVASQRLLYTLTKELNTTAPDK